MALPLALPGELQTLSLASAGRVALYAAGPAQGTPLLLVHSVNAAAAASEVRPLFEHQRHSRPVFAIDLPGYGHSERSARDYTPRLMVDAIHGAVAHIQSRCGPGPIDALALSLSTEFLARAAVEQPLAYRSLALVSPTGLRGGQSGRGPQGSTRAVPGLGAVFRGPGGVWGRGLFRQLTRPGVIRYFLRKTWGGQTIDEAMWAYAVRTAQEPGAEHAPLCFLTGGLFSADIHTVYESLTMPVWASHGVRGDFTDYRGKTFLEQRPNWHFTVFQTGALPFFEVGEAFNAAYAEFLQPLAPSARA
jgi:pimeloyl-ACP methyl ester carboxylesterase